MDDKSIYDLLLKLNLPIRSICGGLGTCGKCKVLIQKGSEYLNQVTNAEKKLLSNEDLESGNRLACQTKINNNYLNMLQELKPPHFRIFLPSELLFEDFNILTSGIRKKTILNPAIKKFFLDIKKPTLDEPIPDFERVITEIIAKDNTIKEDQIKIDFNLINKLPKILRENNHKITLTLWNDNEIIECEPNNTTENNYGIAFDIGTTTIVGYLISLDNGKIYSLASKLNSQTAYGEDLITRLTFIKNDENGLQKLNLAVLNDLNNIISEVCEKSKIESSQIYEATIVGNSVMHHIFLNLDPINIGLSPFIPVIQKGMNIKARTLNLNISKNGYVYTVPLIAGFVGADTVGVIFSSNINSQKDLTLAIDIGTNGEIILGNRKFLATGSCAAGSALEGAHISDGMRAAAGAIDTIKIDPQSFDVSYSTIKNKKPIGICGSGLVDAVAEMLKSKILTRSGNFNKEFIDQKIIYKKNNNIEFIIARREETAIGKEIKISQNDIRQIQMAKAAFYSGSRLILKHLRTNHEIKQVFLAGAFGNYINKYNAKFIGMIPDISDEKIFQIGNAAGVGAQSILLNKGLREKVKYLLKKIKYVEIATEEEFQKEYTDAMYFPHFNLELFPTLKEYNNIPKR
ncbi:MAG: ASKHA domain-containing protein [Candidatus Hodarchaeota archaeon]